MTGLPGGESEREDANGHRVTIDPPGLGAILSV